ncbi:GNAT family N-acetyltransferase [Micromonosporaceae bacterium Da 78-11]
MVSVSISIRPVALDDNAVLAGRYAEDRDFLRSWDPARPDDFHTPAGQRAVLARLIKWHADGSWWAGVIMSDGEVVGRIDLQHIVRGPMQSCSLGYWVARAVSGRGIATEAVAQVLRTAFGELGLHRVDAYARAENVASCRVLDRNDFERVGISRGHVYIDGRWRDDVHFQRLAPWDDGIRLSPPAEF